MVQHRNYVSVKCWKKLELCPFKDRYRVSHMYERLLQSCLKVFAGKCVYVRGEWGRGRGGGLGKWENNLIPYSV